MQEEKIYTIGQIAKICNVSTEQLRHYDKKNILSPKGKRGDNNYRYYTEAQIDDILLIKELKSVGMPLKAIAVLLEEKNLKEIKALLEKEMQIRRKELYEKQRRYDQMIDVLMRLNNAMLLISDSFEEEFSVVSIAERPVVFIRNKNLCSAEVSFISRYPELLKIIENENQETSRSMYLLFHDHYEKQFAGEEEIGDLELFSNITGTVKNTSHCRMFGGFLAACATHIGPYRYTEKVYKELEQWAIKQGYSVSGVSFQEIIVGRTMTNKEENYVTKIYLPLNVKDI